MHANDHVDRPSAIDLSSPEWRVFLSHTDQVTREANPRQGEILLQSFQAVGPSRINAHTAEKRDNRRRALLLGSVDSRNQCHDSNRNPLREREIAPKEGTGGSPTGLTPSQRSEAPYRH